MLIPSILALICTPIAQQPVYPEGAKIPRSMTAAEQRWVRNNPIFPPASAGPPPGDIFCPPEYAPMDGILIAWEGSSSWTTILAKMTAQITTTGGADVHVMVDSASERNTAATKLQNNGANMARVIFHIVKTDTIWIRDYGPRYIYQGDVRSVVDHEYNRPRPRDDDQPIYFANAMGHELYDIPLVHGGGNFHLDALGGGYATRLINNENSSLSEQAIHEIWQNFQALDVQFFDPYSSSIDSTQHLDMWMQVTADDQVIISDWVNNQGSIQDLICETAAIEMAARGFNVHRIPARRNSGTHYTYTNAVMCNDLVLIPKYTNSTIQQYNSQALAVWQQACPNKTIVQINSQAIVTASGVLHCIVMHLPEHRGGSNPTAHLIGPNGGESFNSGDTVQIDWLSDDDILATAAELQLSLDGGQTWPTSLASGLAATGSFSWTVPNVNSSQAQLRVIVNDADGNSGADTSDANFSIGGSQSAANIPYGAGKAGSQGIPQLVPSANPILGTTVTLSVEQALPLGRAYLIRGPQIDNQPFDGAIVLVDYDTIINLPLDGAGSASLTANVPNNAALAGVSFYWQAWVPNDPVATGAHWACSAGLETRLGY